jgi:leader peptidase (prepilin peptidase)/N-methyltransferase
MLNEPLIPGLPLDDWPAWARLMFWLWVAVLGAAVGSFLNVVIYRLPRGMSLVRPGSRCPACGHAIRPRDNLPVAGWLLLRGRCRDCGAAISARYPLVEALVALLFIGLGLLYWYGRESIFPHPLAAPAGGTLDSERRLAGQWAYHLMLVVYLLAAAGMRYDRQSMPRMFLATGTVFAFLLPCLCPWLRPLASGFASPNSGGQEAVFGGLAGAVTGWVVGWLRCGVLPRSIAVGESSPSDPRLYVLVGVVLGWQAVLAVAALAALVALVMALLGRAYRPLLELSDEIPLLMSTLAILAGWRWGAELLDQLGVGRWPMALLCLLSIALISAAARYVHGVRLDARSSNKSTRKRRSNH